MASTYSSNLRLELVGDGEQQGVWGSTTNTNLGQLVEQAIGGFQVVTMVDSDYTLTVNNGALDESRNAALRIESSVSLTATRNVICPTIEKVYIVKNSTTGGRSIVFKTVAGLGVTIPNGSTVHVYVNGTDVVEVSQSPNPVATGGTGATTASAARTNLAAAGTGVVNTFTDRQVITSSDAVNAGLIITSPSYGVYITGATAQTPSPGVAITATSHVTSERASVLIGEWEVGQDVGANGTKNFYIYDGSTVTVPMSINTSGVTTLTGLSLSTDLSVSNGGTGASDAAGARTNLGLGTIATQAADNVDINGGIIDTIDLINSDITNCNVIDSFMTGGTVSALDSPIAVADGGTGAASFTSGALLKGAGTSAITTAVAGVDYLTNNKTITLSGDVSGSGTTAITATLANTAVTAGSYTASNITVDAKGRITSASNGSVVSSFSAGTTGLTPSSGTTGAVTLAGTLSVSNGGTGSTGLSGIIKGNGASAFTAAVSGTDYLAPGAIGTTVQAYSPDLTTISAIAKTSGNFIVGNGSSWVAASGATARSYMAAAGTGVSNTFTGTQVISGLSDAFSNGLTITETTATPSNRSSITLGGWLFGQDVNGSGARDFFIYDGNTLASRFFIGTGGDVGIGTTSPTNKLDVNGAVEATTFEVGSASDTTISRVSAGLIAVEGKTVALEDRANNFSSGQIFGSGAGFAGIYLNGGAGSGRSLVYQTNGSNRWVIATNNNTESTGNAGSNFEINRYGDDGVQIEAALSIRRSDGRVTIPQLGLSGGGSVTVSAAGVLSSSSDSRLKQEDHAAQIPGLDEVLQITPHAYKWLEDIDNRGEDAATEIGFFANEVAPIIPSAAPLGRDGYYGFYDRPIIAALVNAVKELKSSLDEANSRIATLEANG